MYLYVCIHTHAYVYIYICAYRYSYTFCGIRVFISYICTWLCINQKDGLVLLLKHIDDIWKHNLQVYICLPCIHVHGVSMYTHTYTAHTQTHTHTPPPHTRKHTRKHTHPKNKKQNTPLVTLLKLVLML